MFGTYWRGFRLPILAAMLALLVIGVLAIRTSQRAEQTFELSQGGDGDVEDRTGRQIVFAGLGVMAFFAATAVPYGRVGRSSYLLFLLTIGLLVAVFLMPAQRGSRRWIPLPGFSLQPSEVAKLTFVIALAWYLRYRDSYRRLVGLIVPFIITLIPLGLILAEPDLGTSMLLLPTLMAMLFLAGAKLRHLAVVMVLGAMVVFTPYPRSVDQDLFQRKIGKYDAARIGPVTFYSLRKPDSDGMTDWLSLPRDAVAYCRFRIGQGKVYDLAPICMHPRLMKDHQTSRIEGWLRQDDPRVRADRGYQQHQSMMVMGSGQLTGYRGWDQSYTYFHMLPDDHTDFIYSVVGGKWGLLGCLAVLALYAVIFIFGADVAMSTADPFGRLLAVGVLALLAAQIFINTGMTVGLMPITGMTLPLVSYGGSSLLVNCAALGLLVNVGQRRVMTLGPKPFEYGGSNLPEDGSHIAPSLGDYRGR